MKTNTYLLLLLGIVLVSCTQQPTVIELPSKIIEVTTNVTNTTVMDRCFNITDGTQQSTCYFNLAKEKQDSSVCEKVNVGSRFDCYAAVALVQKNQNVCIKIPVDYQRDQCYRGVAIAKDDFIICSSILFNDIRSDCYKHTNATKTDAARCNDLQTIQLRDECRAKAGGAMI